MRLNAQLAVALSEFVADPHDVRDYLRGIHLMPHPSGTGTLAIATDGCIAAITHDEASTTDVATTRPVPPRVLSEARKLAARSKRNGLAYVHWSDTHASAGPVSEEARPIDTRYPDLIHCLRHEISALRTGTARAAGIASIDPKYLERVAKSAKTLGAAQLTAEATGADDNAIVLRYYTSSGTALSFVAFIMPKRAPTLRAFDWLNLNTPEE